MAGRKIIGHEWIGWLFLEKVPFSTRIRATPRNALFKLFAAQDPVGPENDEYIDMAIRETQPRGLLILAWGGEGHRKGRDIQVLRIIHASGARPHCLAETKNGRPTHPLRTHEITSPLLSYIDDNLEYCYFIISTNGINNSHQKRNID